MKVNAVILILSVAVTGCATRPASNFRGEYLTVNPAQDDRLVLDDRGMFEYQLGGAADETAPGTWESTSRYILLEFFRTDDQRRVTVLEVRRRAGRRYLKVVADTDNLLRSQEFVQKPSKKLPVAEVVARG